MIKFYSRLLALTEMMGLSDKEAAEYSRVVYREFRLGEQNAKTKMQELGTARVKELREVELANEKTIKRTGVKLGSGSQRG